MAFYKKQYNKETGVYYPQAVTVGNPVETKEVAERLARISTVSKSDVAAVLGDLAGVLADFMAQGKSVRLDGLGTFRYTLSTEGVKEEKDFDFQKQLKAVRVQFTPAKEGGTTRGSSATRELVPGGIEWLPLDGSAASSSDDGTGGGTQPGGGDDDNPIG
ncbi:HU family DNA-binding protein [uncultured Bacteroides sp.]|uniref:HU family DNA-binding protein n=1 Tax=uncultured Bacteroides sp. TaxID=162156 RepID=UPI00261B9433|nr:HU family DNA-binding protein [uncultured Bacteroides sp.]